MYYIDSYIKQNISNPEWSKIYTTQSNLVGINQEINLTFSNLSVSIIFISGFITNFLIAAPGAFIITDAFNNIVGFNNLLGGGLAGNTFYYIIDGQTLLLRCNNVNVQFGIFYQLVYDRKEKVLQPTAMSAK
jgi:hypothetical protein